MSNKRFGYARVSTTDQNEDRQVLELLETGIEERDIYVDKQSDRSFERTNYLALRNTILRKGDVLVVKSIDRFGRNYSAIMCSGESVGHKRIAHFESVETTALRLTVTQSVALPAISYFSAYNVTLK